jgi:hypothetical protein
MDTANEVCTLRRTVFVYLPTIDGGNAGIGQGAVAFLEDNAVLGVGFGIAHGDLVAQVEALVIVVQGDRIVDEAVVLAIGNRPVRAVATDYAIGHVEAIAQTAQVETIAAGIGHFHRVEEHRVVQSTDPTVDLTAGA